MKMQMEIDNQALYHNVDFGGGLILELVQKLNLGFEERIVKLLLQGLICLMAIW